MKTQLLLLAIIPMLFFQCADEAGDSLVFGDGTGAQGIGGSTARFSVSGNFLYLVNDSQLKSISVLDARNPTLMHSQDIGSGTETIYGYRNHLFIGGQNGMQIFEQKESGEVLFLSRFTHQTACDPVIANDRYAYITIRGGQTCRNSNFNALITVDVADLENPEEVSRIDMISPRGLTFFQGDLYVGEGASGLKRFDISIPSQPKLDTFFVEVAAIDMIGLSNSLIITRSEGIIQYGYVMDSLKLISRID